jgi:NADH:ubiquinone oxidoreductase subunit 2 (subunit N)
LVIIYLFLLIEYIKINYINIINYTLIVLLSIEGLLILVSSNDLCLGFISLELFSLCLYTMLSSKDDSSVGIA